MAKLAFLGLGVMGFPMAGHLVAKGHSVTVYNRSPAKAKLWVERYGQTSAPTPAKAAKEADVVMACVGNDDDLRAVCLGPDGAIAGIMCGGQADHYAQVEPILQSYARICRLLGGPGSGQLAKMMNQICIAGLVQGLAEALAFGQKAGLDGAAVVEVISQGAAGSWQMVNRHKTMLEDKFDFGFAVDWMRKDLGICLSTANQIGASLPVTALVDQFYKDVQRMGGQRNDTSSLIRRLK